MSRAAAVQVPGFRILRRLGAGSSATVYHAIQDDTERELALKVFEPADNPEAATPAEVERERKVAASLRHRNLARIHAVGEHGDRRWLATEYLSGGTLAERIAARMRVGEILQVVRDVAQGLGHAHARGVVHGDVKPGNILFRGAGEAVLVDYGIAAFARDGDRRAMMQGGTPEYMSPQQARGEPVDGRSDFYSLGVVLHEMLTGRVPWVAAEEGASTLARVGVPSLPARHGWLQPLLDALLADCPEDRPADAHALLALLSSLCAASPEAQSLLSRPDDDTEGTRVHGRHELARARRRRLRRRLAILLAGLALVLIGALLGTLLLSRG